MPRPASRTRFVCGVAAAVRFEHSGESLARRALLARYRCRSSSRHPHLSMTRFLYILSRLALLVLTLAFLSFFLITLDGMDSIQPVVELRYEVPAGAAHPRPDRDGRAVAVALDGQGQRRRGGVHPTSLPLCWPSCSRWRRSLSGARRATTLRVRSPRTSPTSRSSRSMPARWGSSE